MSEVHKVKVSFRVGEGRYYREILFLVDMEGQSWLQTKVPD